MNYYYCTIEGASKEVNMEFLSNYLPDNISQLGFLCSECETYMMDSLKSRCTSCESFSQQIDDEKDMNDIISFVFGIPKEKDVLSKNSFFNGVSNIKSIKENNEEIKISFSTDFVFDDDVISTLQNIYKDDNGLYTFQQSNRSESKVVKIGQKILLSENRLLEKCSDGSIYKAKEYSIKNNTIAYVDKNGVLHGATILAKLKLYDTVVFGYDYKSIAEYIL